MINLIIRNSNGDFQEIEVKSDTLLNPSQGEHYYFTDVKEYTFNLSDSDSTMNVYFVDNEGNRVNVVLQNMAELIQQNDPADPFSIDTIFGVSTNDEGDQKIQEALNNTEFESGEIVESLKEALSMDGSTVASGAVIDDFQALLDNLDAAAAGGAEDTAYISPEDADAREYGSPIDDTRTRPESYESKVTDIEKDKTPNSEPYNGIVTLGDVTTLEGTTDVSITATVNNPPLTNLIITLSNGSTIFIPAGGTSGTSTPFSVQGDDVYIDPGKEIVSISSTSGGGYDNLTASDTGTVTVNDTIDDTVITIKPVNGDLSNGHLIEEGTSAQYQLEISNPPLSNMSVQIQFADTAEGSNDPTNGDIQNGKIITVDIPAGYDGSTPITFSLDNVDDVYAESLEDYKVEIIGYTGGAEFENVVIGDPVITTISDENDPDVTTLKLFALLEDGTLADANTIAEQNEAGNADITATYVVKAVDANGTPLATQPTGTVQVNVATGTADNSDFNNPTTVSATINQSFDITSKDDAIADSGERFGLSLEGGSWTKDSDYEKVTYEGTVTTTITDATDPSTPPEEADNAYTLKLFAVETAADGTKTYSQANEIAEQNDAGTADITANYVVLAVDDKGNILASQPSGDVTVNVGETKDSATLGTDYDSLSTRTATIGAEFTIDSKDDALADSGERFSLSLEDGSWTKDSDYEKVTYTGEVTTTIKDAGDTTPPETGDNAYTLKLFAVADGQYVDANTISEPGTSGTIPNSGEYVVLAVDSNDVPLTTQPGGQVTVNVGSVQDGDTDADHNSAATRSVTVGTTPFTVTAEDDALADNNETFKLTIGNDWTEASKYEKVTYEGEVTTTIIDETGTTPPEDNDNAYTLKLFAVETAADGTKTYSQANEIAEQNDAGTADITANYVVLAVDDKGNILASQPSGDVTVNVGETKDSATLGTDYDSLSTRTATIGAEFTIDSKDDALADSGERFSLSLEDGSWTKDSDYEKVTYEGTVTTTITDNDINPPVADAVLTTSNLDTDDAVLSAFAANTNTPNEDDIAFFKKLDIGGGLDGDITNAENDSADPADLGGEDIETTEADLVFDITSLPNYGDLYIEINGTYTKLDASNVADSSTLLSSADNIYWSATHDQVLADTLEKSIGGDYTSSGIRSSWTSDDVSVISRNGNNQDAFISYNSRDGIGVTGANNSGIANQLGYDPVAEKSESIIFDFAKPVTDASVAITHLIRNEGGGEVGKFEAFLDGKSLGVFTFSNNSSAGADYTLTAVAHGSRNTAGSNSGTLNIDNLVFDQLRFSAQEYANQNGQVTDSSDYFIGGITYYEIPGIEFKYKVMDESNNSSEEVPVIINVATDTPVPPVNTNTAPTTTDDTIVTTEDTAYVLTMDDFGTYSDETAPVQVSFESLPANGVLELEGRSISVNTIVNVTDIDNGKLVFKPTADTDNDGSFNFKVSDGELWSNEHTASVNVTAIADIPTVSIVVGTPTTTNNDTTNILHANETINARLGDATGDSNIYGTNGYNYTEFETRDIDFGSAFANKTIQLQMDVTINGSWNNDGNGGYHDDHWTVFVNGVQQALFKYTGANTSTLTEGFDGGVKEYNYGTIGNTNTNINNFNHKPIIDIQLDEQGKAQIKFSAATTETAEYVNINGFVAAEHVQIIDNPDYDVYPLTVNGALTDTDGSETLDVNIVNIPQGALLFDSNGAEIQVNNGSAAIDTNNQSSYNETLEMVVPKGTDISGIEISATSTEANDNTSANATAGENTLVNTLYIESEADETIDLAAIKADAANVDVVDFTDGKDQDIKIDLQDVIDMTDGDNELVIKGDNGDEIDLTDPADWTKSQTTTTVDGVAGNFVEYTNNTNTNVSIFVDVDVDVDTGI